MFTQILDVVCFAGCFYSNHFAKKNFQTWIFLVKQKWEMCLIVFVFVCILNLCYHYLRKLVFNYNLYWWLMSFYWICNFAEKGGGALEIVLENEMENSSLILVIKHIQPKKIIDNMRL